MSKKTVFLVIAILIAIVGIFAYLNSDYIKDKKGMHINAEIMLKEGDKETLLTFDEIKKLGEEEFKANLKSAGNPAVEHSYRGVPLKNVIKEANIDTEDKTQVIVRAVDGFTSAYNISEVLEDNNMYLVYMMDNEPLKSREDGGDGPYQIIVRKDQFSQRWAKYVLEIELQ
ncbi:MAG TPA: molybdopterin-dependent oxidoreductase [Clostridia bacterium]|nr:molybdopterin-dependent oxidoreductase [Clostridia bacterium]